MSDEDPVIARIRAARDHIFLEECEGDPRKLYEYFKQLEAERPEQVVGYEHPGKQQPSGDA